MLQTLIDLNVSRRRETNTPRLPHKMTVKLILNGPIFTDDFLRNGSQFSLACYTRQCLFLYLVLTRFASRMRRITENVPRIMANDNSE